jgi:hypothetical protein
MHVRDACGGSIKCSFISVVSRPVALKVGSLFDQLNVYQLVQMGFALNSSLFLPLSKDNKYCIREEVNFRKS